MVFGVTNIVYKRPRGLKVSHLLIANMILCANITNFLSGIYLHYDI